MKHNLKINSKSGIEQIFRPILEDKRLDGVNEYHHEAVDTLRFLYKRN
jgi:hypothetical protein